MSVRLKRISQFLEKNNFKKEAQLINELDSDLDSFRENSDGNVETVVGKIKYSKVNAGSKSEKFVPCLEEDDGTCVRIYLTGDNPFSNVKLKQLIERLSSEANDMSRGLVGSKHDGHFSVTGQWRRGVLTFEEKDIHPHRTAVLFQRDNDFDTGPRDSMDSFEDTFADSDGPDSQTIGVYPMGHPGNRPPIGLYPKQKIEDVMQAIQALEGIVPSPLLKEVKRQAARTLGIRKFRT